MLGVSIIDNKLPKQQVDLGHKEKPRMRKELRCRSFYDVLII